MNTKSEVVSFDDEPLILVDSADRVLGFLDKSACHNGEGRLHRAFSAFVFNGRGELLLQKRGRHKRLWPSFWSNSCCSHPRRGESMDAAVRRRIEQELGLDGNLLHDLRFVYKFEYRAEFGATGSEHELCSVYLARTTGTPVVNTTEIDDWQWIAGTELNTRLQERPEEYTPWLRLEWGDPGEGRARVAGVTGGSGMIVVPTVYTEGYERARARNEALAENYLRHTGVGDPVLDLVFDELSSLPTSDLHRFVKAGIEQERGGLKTAPKVLREFFDSVDSDTPPWLDYEAFRPAVRVFNLNVTNMLVAFVCGVLIEGFSTLIAKSFAATGRVLSGKTAKRRLMQNNRHLLEVFYPGGLHRLGDGWKLSMRLRFVHGRVRNLLRHSGIWDEETYGIPVSAAHLGLAMTVFSMRLLEYSKLTGALFNKEEAASLMAVWRYAGYVMGVPETVLYRDEDDARRIFEIGNLCEPTPDEDSARMANALIEAVPITAGLTDAREQRVLRNLAYRISRGLIGNELADHLQFPQMFSVGALWGWRMKQRMQQVVKSRQKIKYDNFTQLLQISVYDETGMTYRLPDHAESSKSSPW